ncbi:putative amino acid transporter, transmembrane domain-containing protein [Helianthus annuus]|uniref:Amino acid transporter, transmembrane domain-containing protein n=1 Tax=Helianthus annuus TaxID=4232 RepID=A0A251TSR3_HELAN|nr:amino acid permease 6 [Helianthus annuus]KAF5790018.1 putative amino acid transporter, transmembrane domain-containing protein [Helianthus annuus]KAJ0892323.1 putative amino acid transporter, transmembrane domain-containing protein [Helianthus annuus]
MQNCSSLSTVESGYLDSEKFDDDGRVKRTGTWKSATAHIITAVIGSGVLSLAWCFAQLGWIAGTITLVLFSVITMFNSLLLSDCYRSPDPVIGTRNYTYMDAVKSNLGTLQYKLCGIAQYGVLTGIAIGYTITTSISMAAIKRSNCFHKRGHKADCHVHNNSFMLIFAIIQIILSQVPNFHKLSPLSIVAAVMSFMYSLIGIGLSIAKIIGEGIGKTTLTGIPITKDFTSMEKMWKTFSALGDVAFAYSFCFILIEIQDTLKSSPPENKQMKKATAIGIMASTVFYLLCGVLGYAAFGNEAPGNFLTGFGFYDPFWLVDLANICIVVHLLGAYQVLAQPIFGFVESWSKEKWPQNKLISKEFSLWGIDINMLRFVWRTSYVIVMTIIAMIFPFFNDFVGLLGAGTFWPLSVYFPIEMYISQAKIRKYSFTWIWMQILSLACLSVSLVAAVGSTRGLVTSVQSFKPFQSVS